MSTQYDVNLHPPVTCTVRCFAAVCERRLAMAKDVIITKGLELHVKGLEPHVKGLELHVKGLELRAKGL